MRKRTSIATISCELCREKKVECVQPKTTEDCDKCYKAGIECRFVMNRRSNGKKGSNRPKGRTRRKKTTTPIPRVNSGEGSDIEQRYKTPPSDNSWNTPPGMVDITPQGPSHRQQNAPTYPDLDDMSRSGVMGIAPNAAAHTPSPYHGAGSWAIIDPRLCAEYPGTGQNVQVYYGHTQPTPGADLQLSGLLPADALYMETFGRSSVRHRSNPSGEVSLDVDSI